VSSTGPEPDADHDASEADGSQRVAAPLVAAPRDPEASDVRDRSPVPARGPTGAESPSLADPRALVEAHPVDARLDPRTGSACGPETRSDTDREAEAEAAPGSEAGWGTGGAAGRVSGGSGLGTPGRSSRMSLTPYVVLALLLGLAWLALPPPGPGEGALLRHLRKLREHPGRSLLALALATWASMGHPGARGPRSP